MTAHIHAENMRLYAEDAAETDKPWERWELRANMLTNAGWTSFTEAPTWVSNLYYRRKLPPKTKMWQVVSQVRGNPQISNHFYRSVEEYLIITGQSSTTFVFPPFLAAWTEIEV